MDELIIVDDTEPIRRELASFLTGCGYAVCVLETFEHVVENILKKAPGLVLLGINLPYAGGYHVCRELRRQSDLSHPGGDQSGQQNR